MKSLRLPIWIQPLPAKAFCLPETPFWPTVRNGLSQHLKVIHHNENILNLRSESVHSRIGQSQAAAFFWFSYFVSYTSQTSLTNVPTTCSITVLLRSPPSSLIYKLWALSKWIRKVVTAIKESVNTVTWFLRQFMSQQRDVRVWWLCTQYSLGTSWRRSPCNGRCFKVINVMKKPCPAQ